MTQEGRKNELTPLPRLPKHRKNELTPNFAPDQCNHYTTQGRLMKRFGCFCFSLVIFTACAYAYCFRNTKFTFSPGATVFGTYYKGDGQGIGQFIELRPDSTCTFRCETDTGMAYKSEGVFQTANDKVLLYLGPKDANVLYDTFNIVIWDKRTYIIQDKKMVSFCNAVNLVIEPRSSEYGDYYLKIDRKTNNIMFRQPVSGFPKVPKTWESYMLKKVLIGKITNTRGDIGTINLGLADGIKPNMILLVSDIDPNSNAINNAHSRSINGKHEGLLMITSCKDSTSLVKIHLSNNFRKLKSGQVVMSALPRNVSKTQLYELYLPRSDVAFE